MVRLHGLGKAKTAFRAKYFFSCDGVQHSVTFLLSPLTDVNRAKYSAVAGAVTSAADGLSEPIRVVDLLQPKCL